jgi:hypothetical protein
LNPRYQDSVQHIFIRLHTMDTSSFLVISGAENTPTLWTEFINNITSGTPDKPQTGSMGIHFDLNQNMANLYAECNYDKEKTRVRIHTIVKTSSGTNQLMQFFEFAEGAQPYFFIKKGIVPKWLVRRVGHYRFDSSKHYPHRISYEYVRDATPEECLAFTGKGRHTIEKM